MDQEQPVYESTNHTSFENTTQARNAFLPFIIYLLLFY